MRAFRSYVQQAAFDKLSISISKARFAGMQHEKYVLRRFLQEFQIDCVFDVGANHGQYADLVRSVGYTGPIVSFEPIPALAEGLKARAANDGRWSIEQVALDETVRDVAFNIMASTNFSSIKTPEPIHNSLFSEYIKSVQELYLTTDLLSRYIDRYKEKYKFSRPFLKMDTQGNDLAVAKGAGTKLAEFVGIQSELSVRPLYKEQPDIFSALQFFEQNQFAVCAFLPTHDHFPLLIEVDCIVVNGTMLADGLRIASTIG